MPPKPRDFPLESPNIFPTPHSSPSHGPKKTSRNARSPPPTLQLYAPPFSEQGVDYFEVFLRVERSFLEESSTVRPAPAKQFSHPTFRAPVFHPQDFWYHFGGPPPCSQQEGSSVQLPGRDRLPPPASEELVKGRPKVRSFRVFIPLPLSLQPVSCLGAFNPSGTPLSARPLSIHFGSSFGARRIFPFPAGF